MTLNPHLRKVALSAHITTSVGWLGAVGSFLVLSIAGLTSRDAEIVRSAYLAMNVIGEFVVVPLSLAALVTGIVQSLGTEWGLFRYYWVLVKFVLTIGATALLLLHQFTAVADAARRVSAVAPGTRPDLGNLGIQLVGDAGAAGLALLFMTMLSVFRPWGRIRHDREKQAGIATKRHESSPAEPTVSGLPAGVKIALVAGGAFAVAIIVIHLMGHGPGRHSH